ncbi:glutathione S-transferase family protein [Paludibacterium yongneupense]|uniref:glutathione S-transferase family protein n=1 Tax=Paludibacterium yongneupense TaxID=400061 RepID=UPI000401BAD3|nr:glutathione S-transferase family protein [Paludibacterium yongneupense]
MIKLYGAPMSPYFNKVKIALLEKGVKFEEVLQRPSQEPDVLARSPMGKIPFVEVNGHAISESTAILEWLEDAYPTAALLPPTPNGRARARESMLVIDLYLVPACAPLTRHLVFGRELSDSARAEADAALRRGLAALERLADFGPWLVGEYFSFADISAASALPQIAHATQALLGQNLLELLPGADDYLALLRKRHSIARTWDDKDAFLAGMDKA